MAEYDEEYNEKSVTFHLVMRHDHDDYSIKHKWFEARIDDNEVSRGDTLEECVQNCSAARYFEF